MIHNNHECVTFKMCDNCFFLVYININTSRLLLIDHDRCMQLNTQKKNDDEEEKKE